MKTHKDNVQRQIWYHFWFHSDADDTKKAGVKRREEKIKKQVLINKIDDDHQHYDKFVWNKKYILFQIEVHW